MTFSLLRKPTFCVQARSFRIGLTFQLGMPFTWQSCERHAVQSILSFDADFDLWPRLKRIHRL